MVILDEPTTSVDRETEEQIIDAITKLRGKCTVVVVAHQKKLLDMADSLLSINQGEVASLRA